MIITRSPLRLSFSGGGTDLPAFYKKYGPGAVVSTSINRYVYVTLNHKFDGKVSVRYRNHEMVDNAWEIKHPLIRELLLHYGIKNGVEIVIASEVPARGSGLGASSALAVAMCLALEKFTGYSKVKTKSELAELASLIEIENCGSPIGKQDHYASALGGFNFFQFNSDESVDVHPYKRDEFIEELESQSMLFYLDIEHAYQPGEGSFVQTILKDQKSDMDEKVSTYKLQRDNALRLHEHMEYAVIERFMDHVNENWRIKKSTHKDISSTYIDEIIQKAMTVGATASKLCGAGGGGFIYFMVPPSMQSSVRSAMSGFHELNFKFDENGAECIFEDKKEGVHVRD